MLLPLAAILPSACGGSTSTDPSAFCVIAEPIPNSRLNVPATRVAVDEHNATGVDLCGW